ncbi:MAG: hypothetical protein IH963_00010 [Chloroflexi bacterium]|nr:hypothetical protein [Chloroflexota bacterium]
MHHLLIAVALLSFVVLDLTFVSYSGTPSAALAFAVLSYTTMLLLSSSAGTYAGQSGLFNGMAQPRGVPVPVRVVLAAFVPVALLLILAYLQELDSLIEPREFVRLGSTFVVFWLLSALALVGAFLGFFWPRTGPLESVLVGGIVVFAQSLLSHATVQASREVLQLSLYTWMVWITVCLVGAWAGMVMRQGIEYYFTRAGILLSEQPAFQEAGQAQGDSSFPAESRPEPRLENPGFLNHTDEPDD